MLSGSVVLCVVVVSFCLVNTARGASGKLRWKMSQASFKSPAVLYKEWHGLPGLVIVYIAGSKYSKSKADPKPLISTTGSVSEILYDHTSPSLNPVLSLAKYIYVLLVHLGLLNWDLSYNTGHLSIYSYSTSFPTQQIGIVSSPPITSRQGDHQLKVPESVYSIGDNSRVGKYGENIRRWAKLLV